jgi:hypothetical protein
MVTVGSPRGFVLLRTPTFSNPFRERSRLCHAVRSKSCRHRNLLTWHRARNAVQVLNQIASKSRFCDKHLQVAAPIGLPLR